MGVTPFFPMHLMPIAIIAAPKNKAHPTAPTPAATATSLLSFLVSFSNVELVGSATTKILDTFS